MRVVLATEFPSGISRGIPHVTWGRRGKSSARYSLRLGSYEPAAHVVRLHPVLDQRLVPEFFVRFVIFHELLHADAPPRPGRGGKWVHHPPEFRERERAHSDYGRALSWEKDNLPRLIRLARRGKPAVRPKRAITSSSSDAESRPDSSRPDSSKQAAPKRNSIRSWIQGILFD